MQSALIKSVLPFSIFGALSACGAEAIDGPSDGPMDDVGALELSLSRLPADVACLRVEVRGRRNVSRSFDLGDAARPSFVLTELPVGVAEFEAQAFAEPCAAVVAGSVPAYVTERPVQARIDTSAIAQVLLHLIRNGRASVSIDFEPPPWVDGSGEPVDLAVLGDTPYGAVQIADFPQLISDINQASPALAEIVHVGDIKNGSSRCDTSHFQFVLDNFESSSLPIIYTPGDNEWTDCHRLNNGAYDPLERLVTVRGMFFPTPGLSLGRSPKQLLSQATLPGFETYVENVLWVEAGTVFATIHVVGSNNSLLPWYTDDATGTKLDDPERRTAEVAARTAANLDWLARAFEAAREQSAASVIVMTQADMWDGTPVDGFDTTVQRLASLALDFAKPVLLVAGDSHVFTIDNPLAEPDAVHGVTTAVPNFTRMIVQGSTTAPLTEWVRLHVDPQAMPPFSWTRNAR